MTATQPSSDRRAVFEEALLTAITQGRIGSGGDVLGPQTRSALLAVAWDHPEATSDQITAAFDAWDREQGSATSR